MKILHTADWHLGCVTEDLLRLPEQIVALDNICNIVEKNNIDLVLVAGDIYDSFVPSSELEELFYKTLIRLTRNGKTAVVVSSGNHDDPKKLQNANMFCNAFGIYIFGENKKEKIPENINNRIKVVEWGINHITLKDENDQKYVIAVVPYPSISSFKEYQENHINYSNIVKENIIEGTSHFEKDSINLTLGHILTFGSDLTNEEYLAYNTISNNTAFVEQKNVQSNAIYTALGHMHQPIIVNKEKNICYSGSIINNYFKSGNGDCIVKVIEIENNKVKNIENVNLNSKKLEQFDIDRVIDSEPILENLKDCLIKIVLVNNAEKLTVEKVNEYKKKYPQLVSFVNGTKEIFLGNYKSNLTTAEIFTNYYKKINKREPDDKLKELFLEIISEDLYEAD